MTLVRTAFGWFSRTGFEVDAWVGLGAGCESRCFESGMVACLYLLPPMSKRRDIFAGT